jgi:hypothetical protein
MSDDSGTLATVVSTERKVEEDGTHIIDVVVDAGAGDTEAVELYQAPGEDSLPLQGDSALLQEAPGTGLKACVGFNDPKNAGTAAPGERRGYSRKADGSVAAEYHLKANGDVVIRSFVPTGKIIIESEGPVIVKSPDIRVGDATASRPIACVGDIVAGSILASSMPGVPIIPTVGAPTPSGGVPFTAQIISGSPTAKAK